MLFKTGGEHPESRHKEDKFSRGLALHTDNRIQFKEEIPANEPREGVTSWDGRNFKRVGSLRNHVNKISFDH